VAANETGGGIDPLTRRAFATMVGVVGAVLVALAAGFENPYWAGLSAIVIAHADRDELFTKGILRIAGTFAGVFFGYYGAQLLEGLPAAQALVSMLAAGIGIYARQRSAYAYAWFYGAVTFLIVIVSSMVTPTELRSFAENRCFEIVTGVVVATLARWALGGDERKGAHLVAHPPTVRPEDAMRLAVAAGVGTLAILVSWTQFQLPQLTQVVISSLIVVDIDAGATRRRGWQRVLGCIIGGLAGLLVIGIDATNFLWWLICLSIGLFVFARVHLAASPNAYIGTQSAIAFLVTLVDTGPPSSIGPPFGRLVGIVLGVSLMSLVTWAITKKKATAETLTPQA